MGSDESGTTVIYEPDTGTYQTTHDFTSQTDINTTLSIALEEVAEAEGIQLSQTLYEAINPDALAQLFEPSNQTPRNNGKVMFTLDELAVTVRSTGEIVITPPENA